MARGRLEAPNLDDRSWQDIVDECRALIPRYAPEWTDHNPSDLGITLVELFAWLVEGMIYRLNRVPEKHFVEFLNLLGISRDPMSPAATYLTYSSTNAASLAPGAQASTAQTTTEPPIVFETDVALQILPTNLTTVAYVHKTVLGSDKYKNATKQLVVTPLGGIELLILPADDITLMLGFDQPTQATMTVGFQLGKPIVAGSVALEWRYSRGASIPSAWPLIGGVVDTTAALTKTGSAQLTVPNDWGPQTPTTAWTATPADSMADEIAQPLYWIGLRVQNPTANLVSVKFERVLFNTVPATAALTVQPDGEVLGTSTGKPFQAFTVRNVPLYKRPAAKDPYDHLDLQVRQPQVGGGFSTWATWPRVDYFPAGASTTFRLDPVSGTVSFGNYDTTTPDGQGLIPPVGSEIRARTYRYVGSGARGNVGPGTVTILRTPPPAGITSVKNYGIASGGSDEEDIEDTKRRGPELLRNRNRAVTVKDYEYLAQEATTDVRKVRCLAPRIWGLYELFNGAPAPASEPWTFGNLNRDSGNVNLLIIGDAPPTVALPTPSDALIREVSDYLEARRVVTANLHVTGPRYLPIQASVNVNVWSNAVSMGLIDPLQYAADLRARITQFLHPLYGRADGRGWEFGQDATIAELLDFIRPDSETGFISALSIQAMTPHYPNPGQRPFVLGNAGVWVQLADYEIVCSDTKHTITVTQV